MSKIGFLTDSCSDIPQELADKYGIEVVGFPINLDGTEYMERKDFTNDQFYEMMRDAQGVPTTAAITQLQWCEIYKRYVDEGYTDLVHLSINARRFQHLQQRHQRRWRCWLRSAPAIS